MNSSGRIQTDNAPDSAPARAARSAFTLIELLVVIGILSLLISILIPTLAAAKVAAYVVKVHSELHGIVLALAMYEQDSDGRLPPTRFSCSTRTAYQLPVELIGYLPHGKKNGVDIADVRDVFMPSETYKYRAVGPAIVNETTILENAASLWVQDGFPDAWGTDGRYYYDPNESPVRYAVWSVGPDPQSPKFDVPGHLPVPRRYWLNNAADTGVIVHLQDANGQIFTSP